MKLQENQSVGDQLRVKLKKFKTNDVFAKDINLGNQFVKNMGKIEEIKSLKVN